MADSLWFYSDQNKETKKKKDKEELIRKDVVFKSILRRVRKSYLSEFNQLTEYITTKRFHPQTYLLEKLEVYAESLLDEA